MSELNQLFGAAHSLPASQSRNLQDLVDSIQLSPSGATVPNLRIWVNPTTSYLWLEGLRVDDCHWQGIQHISMIEWYSSQMVRFPNFPQMNNLRDLMISSTKFKSLPSLDFAPNLEYVYFSTGDIEQTAPIRNLLNLFEFSLSWHKITELPQMENLPNLEYLSLRNNLITSVPDVPNLPNLWSMNLQSNQITTVGDLGAVENLDTLNLSSNLLQSPPNLQNLSNLRHLSIQSNQLSTLPDFSGFDKLRFVYVQSNQLTAEAIDAALIQLAAGPMNNGAFNYSNNPGSAAGMRSTEGAAARTTLLGRGWNITI